MLGAIIGATIGYCVYLVAVQKGAGDLLSNPWVAVGYGALLGATALMGS